MMDEYLERVARVLDLDVRSTAPVSIPELPARRERTRELPELDIGILEFFSLYGCELQQVVGKKNSVLGRVMQPVQRLRYEIRFIETAHDCLPTLSDAGLKNALAEAIQTKREALPLAVWNATWGSPEISQFLTRSDGYLPLETSANDVATLASDLTYLNDWLQTLRTDPQPAMPEDLSDIHQRWQALPIPGQLLQSIRLLTARLGDVKALLDQRIEGRPLCINQRPNNQAEILRNLFLNVYAAEVQPYLAAIERIRDDLIPRLARLAQLQQAMMGDALRRFYDQVLMQGADSIWARYDRALHQHTRAWQDLLDQCGMRPQA